jgi:hypothetical protein
LLASDVVYTPGFTLSLVCNILLKKKKSMQWRGDHLEEANKQQFFV